MKNFVLITALAAAISAAYADPESTRPETQVLRKQDYRVPMEEVIVIGQEPYWRKGGKPRWDKAKVEVDLKPATEPRLQVFPNYSAEERDESLKLRDSNRNNTEPKIKIFDIKF